MPPDDPLHRFIDALSAVQSIDSMPHRLCEAARIVLDADGVAVTSETVQDGRRTVCWTDLMSRRLASWQDSLDEGPMIDSLSSGAIVIGDFDRDDDRWHRLRQEVAGIGFSGTVVAIPLRSELQLRGALMVHREGAGRATDEADARFLGVAIGTAVLQDPASGAQGHVFAEVLADREAVHLATEVAVHELGLRYQDSLALLRAIAFARGEQLGDISRAVTDHSLTEVLDGLPVRRPARGRG